MPNDGCRTLEEYVRELVTELGIADPDALARLRDSVGARRARITLDEETVEVEFRAGALVLKARTKRRVDGEGATDRQTVLDLLDGYVSMGDAILDGRLDVRGSPEDVHRIFVAVEILIDASARAPGLQRLARDFRADPCRPVRDRPRGPSVRSRRFPPPRTPAEDALLARLDLLPDGPDGVA